MPSPDIRSKLSPAKTWAAQYLFDAPVTGLAFLAPETGLAALGSGNGRIAFAPFRPSEEEDEGDHEAGDWKEVEAHENGASLCLTAGEDKSSVVSGGDDGRVLRIFPNGEVAQIAHHKGKWIEHLAAHDGAGLLAYSVGKEVFVLKNGQPFGKPLLHGSTVSGIAISPNGKRIAVSHYNGASIWWLNGAEGQKPFLCPWAGSHLGVCWHPDGNHVMTTMQEASLHGWRLSDGMEMRMQGYAAKVASWGWTPRGKQLVTSGSEQAIAWPFTGGGPWGKTPALLGDPLGLLVTAIGTHPQDELVAVGYADGSMVFAALANPNAPPLPILPPTGAPLTHLAWSQAGRRLISGDEAGNVFDFTLQSVGVAFQP